MSLLPEDLFRMQGKTALITGAGRGIGAEIARFLAGAGARVVVNDYAPERASAVAAEINDAGGAAVALQADVTAHASVSKLVEQAGAVDVLVNNAGNAGANGDFSSMAVPFWESDPERWPGWFDVNLTGVMNCTHAVMPGMVARGSGRIITIVSDAGRVGEARLAEYSAAKAGAAGFMRAISRAGGRHQITANCVSLGTVRHAGTSAGDPEADARQLASYTIRRFGTPADVAGVVLLLASEAGSWITGQTIAVNGGYSSTL